jgi:hypothetical protein
MKEWCKIFIHEEHGQILVSNATNEEDKPAVNISWYPNWEDDDISSFNMLIVSMAFETEEARNESFELECEAEIMDLVDETVSDIRLSLKKKTPTKLRLV